MDDYRNSPTIKFCADLFPAHRCPSVIKPLDDPTRLLLRCSCWSLGHRSSDVKSSTARISSHLSNRALLCLQPASAVVCLRHTLRLANSKQRMNNISPKPCHKNCRSANLRVCKSAGLQVCSLRLSHTADNAKFRRRVPYMYRVTIYMKNTTHNTKTSTLTVTLLNKIERTRRIVTAITVVPKEAWVRFGFNCLPSSLHSSEEIFTTGNSLCSALWKSNSLLSHWLLATQMLRLSNLIHILLFKLLSILHIHFRHSDLSLRLWGPWSLNVLTISFVFLWVCGTGHYENTQCYFRVGHPRTVCSFVSLTLDNILQQYVPRNTVAKFSPNCFSRLFRKISDQTISLD